MSRAMLVVLAAVAVTAADAAVRQTPEPVRATRLDEQNPAAAAGVVAWTQNSRARPRHYDAYVKVGAGTPMKINARGTEGWLGGIDGARLVYQQVSARGQSDLKLFDLSMRRRATVPAGINTKRWEWHPTISSDWLLFGRGIIYGANTQQVILRNLATGEQRVLDSIRSRRAVLFAGQVSGNFVAWAKCPNQRRCDVFRYDIAAGTKTEIPNPGGRNQYAPSVTAAGTIYFMRSGTGCGASAELMRASLAGPTALVYSFPEGQDASITHSVSESPIATVVYYDRVSCRTERSDIFRIVDREPPLP